MYADLSINSTIIYEETQEYLLDNLSNLNSQGFVDLYIAFMLSPSEQLTGAINEL